MRILRECEADVTGAASAGEALEIALRDCPDVMIADIGMPGKDGYELIRELRKREGADRRIPAIALTAFTRSEDRARAMREGFELHLEKPLVPAELVAAVARLIGQRPG